MRNQSTDKRVSNRKRRFLLALLAGFSTSGCATSPEPRPSAFSQTAPLPQSAVAGNETKPPNVSQAQPPQLSSTIRTIAYNEGLVSAAPQPVFVQDAEEAEGGELSDREAIEETAQPEVVRPPNSNSV